MSDLNVRSTEWSEKLVAVAAGGEALAMEEAKHEVLSIRAAASSRRVAAAQYLPVKGLSSIELR
jgi:hypothetical protein